MCAGFDLGKGNRTHAPTLNRLLNQAAGVN